MSGLVFGTPTGPLLDVWLALPSLSSVGWFAVGWFTWGLARDVRRWRRQARWPDGKP